MKQLMLGFAREDFSPDKPVRMNSQRTGEYVEDPIFVSCLSFSQGQTRVLLLSMDLRQMNGHFLDIVKPLVSQATGVPEESLIFNATHNHSYPDISCYDNPAVVDWRERIGIPAIIRAAKAAVADEKEVTGMAGGTSITDRISYVRRLQREDGTWYGIASANPSRAPFVAHESIADPELRAVRITRQGGKDVILVNYQTHAASALQQIPEAICADFVGPLRDRLEAQTGGLVVYLQGACGNTNYTPKLKASKEAALWEYRKVGEAMADYASAALNNAQPLALGDLQFRMGSTTCYVNHTKDHLAEIAMQIGEEPDPDKKLEMMHAAGIDNRYERSAIIKRVDMPQTEEMELASLAIGDLAMGFAPVELFDSVGVRFRQASPYPMTFFCGYSLNYRGYIPSHQVWPHGEYEVVMCHYLPGTGEQIVLGLTEQMQDMKMA